MHLKIGTRLTLVNMAILSLSLAIFGPLLEEGDLGMLLIFCLLTAVTGLVLTPFTLPWICMRDVRAIQAALTGLKNGDYAVPLPTAPEPADPDDEYELNRLKREVQWMRRAIALREQDVRRQADRILALNEALRVEAITDKLTGLYNARHFWQCIGECFAEHLRTGETFAFVILDIDFFKRINDTYGHLGGDRVLEQFASALRANTRKTDILARIGGEEFALIARSISSSETESYLHRLQGALREHRVELSEATRIKVTASIGYCLVDRRPCPSASDDPLTTEAIVKRADDALYWVKSNGRDGMMAWHTLAKDYREERLKLTCASPGSAVIADPGPRQGPHSGPYADHAL